MFLFEFTICLQKWDWAKYMEAVYSTKLTILMLAPEHNDSQLDIHISAPFPNRARCSQLSDTPLYAMGLCQTPELSYLI